MKTSLYLTSTKELHNKIDLKTIRNFQLDKEILRNMF